MYTPTHFSESRVEVMHDLIRAHSLATLVTITANGLTANHIPLLLSEDPAPYGTLQGHVARANPIWRETVSGREVLAIFQGANAYITPSWYPTKQETGKVVPTWNYSVVHAYGTLSVIDDTEWIRSQVERLTAHRESDRAQPWAVSDAPREYTEKLLTALVGIEIVITRLEGKWKWSQNQSEANQTGVVRGLRERDDPNDLFMAEQMDKKAT